MKVNFIKPVQFGYKHLLKTYWKEGKMPTVTRGIYGGELTQDTVTLEHLLPHSEKGKTTLSNLALAVGENNWKRGNKPINQFLTKEMLEQYCEQFKGIKLPFFNGDNYVEQITKTIERLFKQGQ